MNHDKRILTRHSSMGDKIKRLKINLNLTSLSLKTIDGDFQMGTVGEVD